MDRINVIHHSLSVFVCGLIGLLPVIGFFPAIIALIRWQRVRRYRDWNPAGHYVKWGVFFAYLGLINSLLAGLVIGIAVSTSWNG